MISKPITKPIDFSLLFFSGSAGESDRNLYELTLDACQYADKSGFSAVWTPERHFQAVGGLFPNPSVLSAAIAVVTKRIGIRAGSVTLPLHDPIRVAEEWAVVDVLSGGRAAISIAPGWHAGDFILHPDRFDQRRQICVDTIKIVRSLWRGDSITRLSVGGTEEQIRTLPRPIQPELPVWYTITQNRDAWRAAGHDGVNVLTALISQDLKTLAESISIYREARRESGLDPESGIVSLMMHTYVAKSDDGLENLVRTPLTAYIRSFLEQQNRVSSGNNPQLEVRRLIEQDIDAFVELTFQRYYRHGSLIGSEKRCIEIVKKVLDSGVNEIACLIDFGLDNEMVMSGLVRTSSLLESCYKGD